MRALEDLVNAVRDPRSRRYIEEAVRAYQVGALRAAIVAAWVAVALDIVGKLRELADTGDATAKDFVRDLDAAVGAGDRDRLMRIERELLTVAHGKVEFIERRERDELERLRHDRNVCAHPAFVRPDQVFEPNPEIVRAHIATAVDAVLSKPPTPGKKAIERFVTEIGQVAFPETVEALTDYLRDRYFQPGKSSLRTNLAELIIKGCLQPPDADELVRRRCARCAQALERIAPGLLVEALSSVVTKREQGPGLDDDAILSFTVTLGGMALAWHALPASSHSRVFEALRTVDARQLVDRGIFGCELPENVKQIVDARLSEIDDAQLARVIGKGPDPQLVDSAIARLEASAGYRVAEHNMENLAIPLARAMNADHVRRVLSAVRENQQIRMASRMPEMLADFFGRTRQVFGDCYGDWFDLVQWLTGSVDDPDGYYAYPELRKLVFARG